MENNNGIDLTHYTNILKKLEIKTIIKVNLIIDKKTALNILQSDYVYVNENKCKVPEECMLEILRRKMFGECYLELEVIDNTKQ